MKRLVMTVLCALPLFATAGAQDMGPWRIHDPERPRPPVVNPGPAPHHPAPAPSDAIVLFDGRDLAEWRSGDGRARWEVRDGAMVVVPRTGGLRTARSFGDVQLHIEWMAPAPPTGAGQNRGNSGVFFLDRYEVQVLDSYQNDTYPDGQAAALYGQYPPMVNAMRPPGEWQTYDIIFRGPRFGASGELLSPARVTVLHNGVLVQDNVVLTGPTGHYSRPPYEAHPERLPISLQDHGDRVRFRNIWVRELR